MCYVTQAPFKGRTPARTKTPDPHGQTGGGIIGRLWRPAACPLPERRIPAGSAIVARLRSLLTGLDLDPVEALAPVQAASKPRQEAEVVPCPGP
jgi:hypothetical protein